MKVFFAYIRDLYSYSKRRFLLNILFMILDGLTSGIGIIMLVPLLSLTGIAGQSELNIPLFGSALSFLNSFEVSARMIIILLIYLILIILQALINRTLTILNSELIQGYTKYLRDGLYRDLVMTDWSCFITKKRSDIANAFTNEIVRISSGTVFFLRMISQIAVAVFQLYVAVLMSAPLTVFVLICGAVILRYMNSTFKESKNLGCSLRIINQELMSRITEQLNSVKEAKSYGIEQAQLDRFEEATEKTRRNLTDFSVLQSKSTVIYKIGAAVVISALFYVSVTFLKISPTALLIIIYIFARLWPVFTSFQSNVQNVLVMIPSYSALNDLMNDLQMHAEKTENEPETQTGRTSPVSVRFENVSFHYDDPQGFELKNLNLEIPAKGLTALTGKSGAGKSTIVDLLLGLLKPSEGQIIVDGEVVDESNLSRWRKRIGYVPQDSFLFNSTIRENLLRFTPGASDEEIAEALRLSEAMSFVEKLPQGVDTVIGDCGVRLSGGERQRIVLARALLRKPQILVLDEATSSLDGENEYKIQKAVESFSGKLTVVVIAHRLSTIRNADNIIVIENGRITEQGSYDELLKNKEGFLTKTIELSK